MFSMIHTPLLPDEIKAVFKLTPEIYSMALERGALNASYSDADDPVGRLRMHNLSDAIFFAAILALGWPIRPVDILIDQADCITDDLYFAWEEVYESDFPLGVEQESHFKNQARSTNEKGLACFHAVLSLRPDLSTQRRGALLRYIEALMDLVSVVVSHQHFPTIIAIDRRCGANSVRDAIHVSSVVAAIHEQNFTSGLQKQELANLQRSA